MRTVGIVGGGPAGLRAAEVLSRFGVAVTLYEGKPSVGRKFLVAGRGGLNLTHSEASDLFASRYQGSFPEGFWTSLLEDFANDDIREWASELGVETFVGTSGRVFPKQFQSAHLLRRWLQRLKSQGILLKTRWKLTSFKVQDDHIHLVFLTKEGKKTASHDAVILALGGASWPDTGSDGSWVELLQKQGMAVTPLAPANCGWDATWNQDILTQAEGQPLKNLVIRAGQSIVQGELLITKTGLEGGALYKLGYTLRSMENPEIILDLKPTFTEEELIQKITPSSGSKLLLSAIRIWRLSPGAAALLRAFAPSESQDSPIGLARQAKALRIPLTGPRPIGEAISTAGGVSFAELDASLMVSKLPGLFVAGEMLDWEAPTGGYLLQGCFTTGIRAAQGVLNFLQHRA